MDRRFCSFFRLDLIPLAVLLFAPVTNLWAQPIQTDSLANYRQAALRGGDPVRGKGVFDSKEASCLKCHTLEGTERRAGPDLRSISDKYGREQLIQAVLEPNATIHPDYGTIIVTTVEGKVHTGVLYKRSQTELQLLDIEGKRVQIPVAQIETEKRSGTSLMPIGLQKQVNEQQFADLIAYLETQKQPEGEFQFVGMPSEIPLIDRPVSLVELHNKINRFDHPVCVIAVPGTPNVFLVVEQKSRKIWRYERMADGDRKELFADFSSEATTGEFEGVVCLALHPRFLENRKYYVNYHVRNQGSFFSPVIVERQASADFRRDAGIPSRRLLQIPQDTDLHQPQYDQKSGRRATVCLGDSVLTRSRRISGSVISVKICLKKFRLPELAKIMAGMCLKALCPFRNNIVVKVSNTPLRYFPIDGSMVFR